MGYNEAKLIDFLKKKGGIAGFAEIIKAGFHKATLTVLLTTGYIQKIERGLYKLSAGPAVSNPDLVIVSIKAPKGVVCLLSALAFHEATNEIPRFIDIAIHRGAYANKIDYPPVRFYRFAPNAWKAGIREYKIEGHSIRVYSLAKTVADCFKFRNRIGVDIARTALKVAVKEKRVDLAKIMYYGKICRVDNIIKPILESII